MLFIARVTVFEDILLFVVEERTVVNQCSIFGALAISPNFRVKYTGIVLLIDSTSLCSSCPVPSKGNFYQTIYSFLYQFKHFPFISYHTGFFYKSDCWMYRGTCTSTISCSDDSMIFIRLYCTYAPSIKVVIRISKDCQFANIT